MKILYHCLKGYRMVEKHLLGLIHVEQKLMSVNLSQFI